MSWHGMAWHGEGMEWKADCKGDENRDTED